MPAVKQHASRSAQARLETSAVYKRLVIMLRSLFSYVRALPAYRLFRAWKVRRPDNTRRCRATNFHYQSRWTKPENMASLQSCVTAGRRLLRALRGA